MTSSIGDRMKRYEAVYDRPLTPRSPLLIRIDGRAFHTLLRKAEKPFDHAFIAAMVASAEAVAAEMQGFKLAYHQSDECTFLLTDYDNFESQGWFDYKQNKVVSITASMFTAHFNLRYRTGANGAGPAIFDARAFTVPLEDAPNAFIWRQRDWERNSVQMLARAHFPHKQCHGKKIADLHEMLHSIGINWANLDDHLKNGTFIDRDGERHSHKASYDEIKDWIAPNGDS